MQRVEVTTLIYLLCVRGEGKGVRNKEGKIEKKNIV